MKTTLIILLFALTGYYTYYNYLRAAPPNQQIQVIKGVDLLPEGLFYTRERIKDISDVGMKVIPGGVEVIKVGEESGYILISYNKSIFKVEPYKLTNELDEALRLAEKFKIVHVVNAPIEAPQPKIEPISTPTEPSSTQKQIDAINLRIKDLKNQLQESENKNANARSAGRSSGHGAIISRLKRDIEKLEQYKKSLKQ